MRSRDYEEGYDAAIDDMQMAIELSEVEVYFGVSNDPNTWAPKLKELRKKRFIG